VLKLARDEGVVVRGVQRNAPAGKAGIEPGDVIVQINGADVRNTVDMLNTIAQLAPASSAKVRVVRGAKELNFDVTVGERPVPRRRQ
jgi:S1-C subfamily serine protease